MGDELDGIAALQGCDKIVSSLVFHQCPMEIKQAIAAQMHRLLRPGGQLFIADYGEQRSPLMRLLFRQIQWQIGRASCRERESQSVYISVVGVELKKKKKNN